MQRQEQKNYLNELLIYLEKKGAWIGEPILIVKYLNSNSKYFILFSKKTETFFLNIDIASSSFWTRSKCEGKTLSEQTRYLANNFNNQKAKSLPYK